MGCILCPPYEKERKMIKDILTRMRKFRKVSQEQMLGCQKLYQMCLQYVLEAILLVGQAGGVKDLMMCFSNHQHDLGTVRVAAALLAEVVKIPKNMQKLRKLNGAAMLLALQNEYASDAVVNVNVLRIYAAMRGVHEPVKALAQVRDKKDIELLMLVMEHNLGKIDICTQSLTILRDFANEDAAEFAEATKEVSPDLIAWRVMNTMKAFPSEDHIQHHACLTIAALAKHSLLNKSLGRLGAVALVFHVATDVLKFPFETVQAAVWAIVQMATLESNMVRMATANGRFVFSELATRYPAAPEEKERDDDAKKADVSKPVIYMPRRYRNIDWDAIPKSDDAIVNDRDAQKQASKMYDRMYNTNDDTLPVPEQLLKTAMDVKSAIAEAMDGHDATVPIVAGTFQRWTDAKAAAADARVPTFKELDKQHEEQEAAGKKTAALYDVKVKRYKRASVVAEREEERAVRHGVTPYSEVILKPVVAARVAEAGGGGAPAPAAAAAGGGLSLGPGATPGSSAQWKHAPAAH